METLSSPHCRNWYSISGNPVSFAVRPRLRQLHAHGQVGVQVALPVGLQPGQSQVGPAVILEGDDVFGTVRRPPQPPVFTASVGDVGLCTVASRDTQGGGVLQGKVGKAGVIEGFAVHRDAGLPGPSGSCSVPSAVPGSGHRSWLGPCAFLLSRSIIPDRPGKSNKPPVEWGKAPGRIRDHLNLWVSCDTIPHIEKRAAIAPSEELWQQKSRITATTASRP